MQSFKEYHGLINEAAFGIDKLERAVKLIKRILRKEIGEPLYQFGVTDKFIVQGKAMYGIRYFVGNEGKKQFRINWRKGNQSDQIHSLDIWKQNAKWNKPTWHVDLQQHNIIQVVKTIAKIIKRPAVGDFPIEEGYESFADILDEANVARIEMRAGKYELTYNGETLSKSTTKQSLIKRFKRRQAEMGWDQLEDMTEATPQIIVTKGKIEKSLIGAVEEKILQKTKYADPEVIFADLEDLTALAVGKFRNSLLVTGMAGVGKTYVVEQVINRANMVENEDWFSLSGSVTAYGMYSRFVKSHDKLIVFDDCDSVFKDADARNLLKAALDTKPVRKISWVNANTFDRDDYDDEEIEELMKKGKLPNSVNFTGQVIFISNLPQSKIEPAILSRSFVIDITLKAEDVYLRIESILPDIEPDVSMAEKKEVLEFLRDEGASNDKHVNMRTFLGAMGIKKSGLPRWKHLAQQFA